MFSKKLLMGWGDGSVDKSALCACTSTRVQISVTLGRTGVMFHGQSCNFGGMGIEQLLELTGQPA